MNRWLRVALAAVVVTALVIAASGRPVSAGTDPPPPTAPSSNEFLPEDANLTDCVSALPRPECGSEARGGWRQAAVFGVLAGGLAIIGWRIVVGMRRRTAPRERTPT